MVTLVNEKDEKTKKSETVADNMETSWHYLVYVLLRVPYSNKKIWFRSLDVYVVPFPNRGTFLQY